MCLPVRNIVTETQYVTAPSKDMSHDTGDTSFSYTVLSTVIIKVVGTMKIHDGETKNSLNVD